MIIDEFLKRVRNRAGLDSDEESRRDVLAVLETLNVRLSNEASDSVAVLLPKELREMWDSTLLERLQRSFGGAEHMDLDTFFARIAQKAGLLDVSSAEKLTLAVFVSVREQLNPITADNIGHQLPADIGELWNRIPLHTPNELVQEQIWGIKTDVPSGHDVDMTIAQAEAQVREMHAHKEHGGIHPPAEERVENVASPDAHDPKEGPANEAYYRLDPQLRHEIMELLEESDELEAQSIDVFVQAGNVTLRGHVKSSEQRDSANRLASKAIGIGEIRNELVVEK